MTRMLFPLMLVASTAGNIAGVVADHKTGEPLAGVAVLIPELRCGISCRRMTRHVLQQSGTEETTMPKWQRREYILYHTILLSQRS